MGRADYRAAGGGEMTTSDLLARAQSTYPPTCIGLRTVCKRIGTASQIAEELRLGEHGGRTVRKWISSPSKVPFSVWFTLLAIDEALHAAND